MNVLVIEDDDDVRETLVGILEAAGHRTLEAATGRAGLHLAQEGVDFIFCDVGLPDTDGFHVAEERRQSKASPGAPFVFLTGRTDRSHQRTGMALGADDYITKPFSRRDILDSIEASQQRRMPLKERIEQLQTEHVREASAKWSHELLTPMSVVLGAVELLETDKGEMGLDDRNSLARLIRSGAERQLAVSWKLITHHALAQQLLRGTPVQRKTCDAIAVAGTAARAAGGRADRARDVEVCGTGCTAAIDPAQLGEAVAELVENGLKFSRPGEKVTVTTGEDDGLCRLTVADWGSGMTDAEKGAVAPFVQFRRGQTEQQGLGLGLSNARTIVEQAGGRLQLFDRPAGHGLLVVIELPMTVE
jgi:two-component system, sensor histidine kinase and response regulator